MARAYIKPVAKMITFHESDMIATTPSGDVKWGDWDDDDGEDDGELGWYN
jgi:hypothetical protein